MKLEFPKHNSPLWGTLTTALIVATLAAPQYTRAILPWALVILIFKAVLWIAALIDGELDDPEADGPLVDPWAMQRELMYISDQSMPTHPRITNDTVLYAALIMEELGETLAALSVSLIRFYERAAHDDPLHLAENIGWKLHYAADHLRSQSVAVRDVLKRTKIEYAPLREEVKALLDGTTDIAVVNSGFALAAGLPGAEAYEEVARSNFSKADPGTGLIEKDASGKWIKGRDYAPPDLDAVLDRAEQEHRAWEMRVRLSELESQA